MIALDWFYPSEDEKFLAYGISKGGDKWSTLHVVEVDTGRLLEDKIPRTRYSSIA